MQSVNPSQNKVIYYCGSCEKPKASKLCGRCKKVYYCDATCQKTDWVARHKKSCQAPEKTKDTTGFIPSKSEPVHKLNALHNTTSFFRFPHLYLDMMKTPLEVRNESSLLLIGPGVMSAKDLGETNEKCRDAIYCPQLQELMMLYPQSPFTIWERTGEVFNTLEKSWSRIVYPKGYAAYTLTKNDFKNPQNYKSLMEVLKNFTWSNKSNKLEFAENDISKQSITKKYGVIVATKVLLHSASEAMSSGKREDRIPIAVNLLANYFSGLQTNGKLYIDKESIDLLLDLSELKLKELLQKVKDKLTIKNEIQSEIIPHDLKTKDPETGRYDLITVVGNKSFYLMIDTDDIYKFTI